MKVIIMAGGYAKRMWPLTENQPKSLLPVAGINYIIDKLDGIERSGNIIVSTNNKFGDVFHEWEKNQDQEFDVVVEPTMKEDEKFGTVGAINWLIKEKNIDDDILIIGGDNLFELDLKRFLDFQKERGGPSNALYDLVDYDKVRKKLGVCILGDDKCISEFQEKPEEPKSALVSTCIYYFPKEVLKLIDEYLSGENSPDSPGFFVQWLMKKMPVHGFVFNEKWYDIGSFDVYDEVNQIYGNKQ